MIFAVGLVLALAACGARPTAGPQAASPPPDYAIVIPLGAAEADLRGEASFVIASPIRVLAGQRIVIRNDDHAMHYFFDKPIAPGETLIESFARAGRYSYSGMKSCSIGQVSSLAVEVT